MTPTPPSSAPPSPPPRSAIRDSSAVHDSSAVRSSSADADALPVAAARTIIREYSVSHGAVELATEKVALRDALGRVLAGDLVSPIDVPAHDNSAMDGYAFDGAALTAGGRLTMFVAGRSLAGGPFAGRLSDGHAGPLECVRIMTGALLPAGCDTVIPQEAVELDPARPAPANATPRIQFAADAVRRGANRRRAGEDLAAGRAALAAGRVLRPADLGLIASLGIAEVAVRRRLRVAFFSTGNELRAVGEPLEPGCVYDSNRYTLYGMLRRLGVDIVDMGIVKDSAAALETAFRSAAANADVIVTSGGVSVGEADLTRALMSTFGEVAFWKIAMRPGRPFAFGRIWSGTAPGTGHPALLFGLPGNPVAVMVTFCHFVREALLLLQGATHEAAPLMRARARAPIRKRPGRTEYQRGIAHRLESGHWEVALTGAQGSGMLSSMSGGNCFVVLDHEQSDVAAGDEVDIVMFDTLI